MSICPGCGFLCLDGRTPQAGKHGFGGGGSGNAPACAGCTASDAPDLARTSWFLRSKQDDHSHPRFAWEERRPTGSVPASWVSLCTGSATSSPGDTPGALGRLEAAAHARALAVLEGELGLREFASTEASATYGASDAWIPEGRAGSLIRESAQLQHKSPKAATAADVLGSGGTESPRDRPWGERMVPMVDNEPATRLYRLALHARRSEVHSESRAGEEQRVGRQFDSAHAKHMQRQDRDMVQAVLLGSELPVPPAVRWTLTADGWVPPPHLGQRAARAALDRMRQAARPGAAQSSNDSGKGRRAEAMGGAGEGGEVRGGKAGVGASEALGYAVAAGTRSCLPQRYQDVESSAGALGGRSGGSCSALDGRSVGHSGLEVALAGELLAAPCSDVRRTGSNVDAGACPNAAMHSELSRQWHGATGDGDGREHRIRRAAAAARAVVAALEAVTPRGASAAGGGGRPACVGVAADDSEDIDGGGGASAAPAASDGCGHAVRQFAPPVLSAPLPARLAAAGKGAVGGLVAPHPADSLLRDRSSAMLDELRERVNPLVAAARAARDAHYANGRGAKRNQTSAPRRALASAISAAETSQGLTAVLRRVGISACATSRAGRRSETSLGGVGSEVGDVPHWAGKRRHGRRPATDVLSGVTVALSRKAAAVTLYPAGTGMQRKPDRSRPPQTPPTAPPSVVHPKRAPATLCEGETAASSKENRDSGGQVVRASCGLTPGPGCGGAMAARRGTARR